MDTEQLMMKKSLYEGETWLGKPPEIEESRIEKTMEADVVVVGAGLAGVAAARAAATPASPAPPGFGRRISRCSRGTCKC